MYSYGVVIDGNMMQNAFETNTQSDGAADAAWVAAGAARRFAGGGLLHPYSPDPPRGIWSAARRQRHAVVGGDPDRRRAVLWDYASLIRNNKSVVKMLTPSNFVAGTIKFTEQRYFHAQSAAGKNR